MVLVGFYSQRLVDGRVFPRLLLFVSLDLCRFKKERLFAQAG
jgi:hypothetical protein